MQRPTVVQKRWIISALAMSLICLMVGFLAVGCGGETTTESSTETTVTTESTTETSVESTTTSAAETTVTTLDLTKMSSGEMTTGVVVPEGLDDPSKLKIAYFSAAANNSYLMAGIQAAKDMAAYYGATVEVFDGKWDATAQYNQVQDGIDSGRFNAIVFEGVDARVVSPLLLDAIKGGKILIDSINLPLNNRELNEGDAVWEPGSVTYVGGQTHDVYMAWWTKIFELAKAASPDGGKAALLTGPWGGSNAMNCHDALEKLLPGTGVEVVADVETDYTTESGYTKIQDVLQANPDLKFIITNYSGLTQGVVQAVDEAGLLGKIQIYDFGGNEWAIEAVKSGDIAMTTVMLPYTEVAVAVQAIADTVLGKPVPKFINLTMAPFLPGTPFITKDNVAQYTAQYQ